MRKEIHMYKKTAAWLLFAISFTLCACTENVNSISNSSSVNNEITKIPESGGVGITVSPSPQVDILPSEWTPELTEIYGPVLDGYYADIVGKLAIDNYFPMTLGTLEVINGSADDTALDNIGYAIKDINGDGNSELLIMKVYNRTEASCPGREILALYTQVNGNARFLAGGWARNRYYLLSNGKLLNEGSSGADDSNFETFELIENTGVLSSVDWIDSKSDNFKQQLDELENLIEEVELKTFAQYEASNDYTESAKTFWSAVYVDSAAETYAVTGSDSYTADISDYARDLVFFTPFEVSEFRFNALTPVDFDGGKVIFAEQELYFLESLVMDKAVTITMEFAGDTPHYGISYKDAAGNVRRYAIGESGFDGSIFLTEYEIAR